MEYSVEDFNLEGDVPREMVQYVIDNIEDFGVRYYLALKMMDRMRCPLSMANESLYDEIKEKMVEWAMDNNITDSEFEEFDAEEIFG